MLDIAVIRTSVAVRYGKNVAIILEDIRRQIEHNRVLGENFHDGYYWTRSSVSAFHGSYPFISEKAISAALRKAKDNGLIVIGNYNELPFDQTKWYALTAKGEEA